MRGNNTLYANYIMIGRMWCVSSIFYFKGMKFQQLPSIIGMSSALQWNQFLFVCCHQNCCLLKCFLKVLHTHKHTHTRARSPCTPLRGRGPAPALPGVKEAPDDALLMTCQKERALHAPAYFTYSHVKAGHYHLSSYVCQDLESMLAVPC